MNTVGYIAKIQTSIKEYRFFLAVILCSLIYTLFFTWVGIWWHGLYYTNVDLDIFEQALWTTLNTGDILYANEYGGSSHFGTHFSPILFFMLPVYALFQYTETIIIIQVCLLAAGAIPLYFISSRYLSRQTGVIISILYLLYPALHGVTTCEFHEIVFFPVLYLISFAFLIRNHYWGYIISALLCLMIKEDIGLMVIMLGLWALWQDRAEKKEIKILHIGVILIAVLTIAAAMLIIIPSFNPEGVYPHFSHAYFTSEGGIDDEPTGRLSFIIQLFAPLLGLPFIASEVLIIGLPGFLELFIPEYPAFRDIGQHYSAIIIPAIFIALIFALVRLEDHAKKWGKNIFPAILILLLLSSGISTILISPSPLSIGFQHIWAYDQKIQPYKNVLDPILEELDKNKEIAIGSHHPLLTHLSRRKNLHTTYNNSSDIILIAEGYPDGRNLKNQIESEIFVPVYISYDITIHINKKGRMAEIINKNPSLRK